jgi:hypothetical protein
MLVRNNITSLTNDTTTTTITNAKSLNSVSVIAMRVPINLADILSLAERYGIQLGQYPLFTFLQIALPIFIIKSHADWSSSLTDADR